MSLLAQQAIKKKPEPKKEEGRPAHMRDALEEIWSAVKKDDKGAFADALEGLLMLHDASKED